METFNSAEYKQKYYLKKLILSVKEDLKLLQQYSKDTVYSTSNFRLEIEKILRDSNTIQEVLSTIRSKYSELDTKLINLIIKIAGNLAQISHRRLFPEVESKAEDIENLRPKNLTLVDATGQEVDLSQYIYSFSNNEDSELINNRVERVSKVYYKLVEDLIKQIISESQDDKWQLVRNKIYRLKGLYAKLASAEASKNIRDWIEIERYIIELNNNLSKI